ncbi:transposase [Niabella yanshanensis]|uniref:transposase n=1 Tax=Niabella yanshanensis TaxID=577386 RepID=UPI001B85F459|nr:transposase [Niabella yanshanensis]
MVILFELQDINRFKNLDHLCGYSGLVPDTGDTKIVKGITGRQNHFLRTALVESSWSVIRKDPAMLMGKKQSHHTHCQAFDC